jgi:hypothetical protein
MPRSVMGTKKASATGIAKSAKGQATAAAASSKAKKPKKNVAGRASRRASHKRARYTH